MAILTAGVWALHSTLSHVVESFLAIFVASWAPFLAAFRFLLQINSQGLDHGFEFFIPELNAILCLCQVVYKLTHKPIKIINLVFISIKKSSLLDLFNDCF
jgi:hypothetical protein